MVSRLITRHDKIFNKEINKQTRARLSWTPASAMTRQESTRQRVPLRPIPALQWTGRNCSYHQKIQFTKHIIVIIVIFTKGPIPWLLHVLIHPCSIIMIINNTDYLYSQHCHDHIDENQHDNLNRSSWSATYWWPSSFRERSRASDSQKEFQETIRWLSTMVKIRNYSQKFGEDVPENTAPPSPPGMYFGQLFHFCFSPTQKVQNQFEHAPRPLQHTIWHI